MRLTSRSRKRNKRKVPQLNTTSTADISFMLLIFFLITTSMDNEKGLRRQLPPPESQHEIQSTDIDRLNVLSIGITADNKATINDSVIDDKTLRRRVTEHVNARGKDHVIELKADPRASYDTYFNLQNSLVATYPILRDKEARRVYKRPFSNLSQEEKDSVRSHVPQRISEQFTKEGGTQ